MQFEIRTITKRVTAGNIMEIIMGRALTTQRYDIYDFLQKSPYELVLAVETMPCYQRQRPKVDDI